MWANRGGGGGVGTSSIPLNYPHTTPLYNPVDDLPLWSVDSGSYIPQLPISSSTSQSIEAIPLFV